MPSAAPGAGDSVAARPGRRGVAGRSAEAFAGLRLQCVTANVWRIRSCHDQFRAAGGGGSSTRTVLGAERMATCADSYESEGRLPAASTPARASSPRRCGWSLSSASRASAPVGGWGQRRRGRDRAGCKRLAGRGAPAHRPHVATAAFLVATILQPRPHFARNPPCNPLIPLMGRAGIEPATRWLRAHGGSWRLTRSTALSRVHV